ncbi:MAG: hypothetical protein LKE34_00760 [Bacteroidales bacterium]|nr:hypothetical protein [Bacteroidales bacterium]
MRRFLILLCLVAVSTAFASCGKVNKWSERTIDINVRENVTTKADEHLTPAQIVRKAYSLDMSNGINAFHMRRGWAEQQRDTVNNKLLMYSTDVISIDGELMNTKYDFINVQSAYIVDSNEVVIAYIPSAVLRKAHDDIIEAYNRNDYDAVYKLFNDAYEAIPITQAEYDALVERGEQ